MKEVAPKLENACKSVLMRILSKAGSSFAHNMQWWASFLKLPSKEKYLG